MWLVSKSKSVQVRAMAAEDGKDPRLARISSAIRVIPDFPKPGTCCLLFNFCIDFQHLSFCFLISMYTCLSFGGFDLLWDLYLLLVQFFIWVLGDFGFYLISVLEWRLL